MQVDWEVGPDGTHGVKREAGELALYDPISGTRKMTEMGANSPLVLTFQAFPTANGIINLVGGYEQTDAAAVVTSAAPYTSMHPYFNSKLYADITAVTGEPFTLRITGTSVNQIDASLTPADTEDIPVTAIGKYASTKYWIDAPQVSIVEASKSATMDLAKAFAYSLGGKRLTVKGLILLWTPDGTTWDLRVNLVKISSDGTLSDIFDVVLDSTDTPPWAGNLKLGRYKLSGLNGVIDGTIGEGVYLYADQQKIADLLVGIEYE
jgi:hypothetical protein